MMKTSVALLIDHENVPDTTLTEQLVNFALSQGNLSIQRAYAQSWKRSLTAKNILQKLGFSLVTTHLPIKNSADYRCMFDCVDLAESHLCPDIFIFVAGDGDYAVVIRFLKSRGKRIIVFARQGSASKQLEKLAHEFYLLDKLDFKGGTTF